MQILGGVGAAQKADISGGQETNTVNGYKYVLFTSSGNLTVNVAGDVDVLVVAGGGGGGADLSGAGGAGAIEGSGFFQTQTLATTTYSVTVGAQGNGSTNNTVKGASGGNSVFTGVSTITALGGGGGSYNTANGVAGGSGGGGSFASGVGGAASGSNTFAGGNGVSISPNYGTGGGGGATAVGLNGTSTAGGNGGQGKTLTVIDTNLTAANFTTLTGMTVISSGGGGACYNLGTAGLGGTGAGNGTNDDIAGGNAVSFGSGGGGEGGTNTGPQQGGNGKQGIVIFRVLL